MSLQEGLSVVRGFWEAYNAQDWDQAERLLADDITHSGSDHREPLRGPAAVRRAHEGLGRVFPDYNWKVEQLFGTQEGWVCLEATLTGTHQGPMPFPDGDPIPATNRGVRLPGCFVFKVEGGKITQWTGYADFLSFYAQLGVAPGAGPGVAARQA